MLGFKLRKNHAGIMLTGDSASLRRLHKAVHDVQARSSLYQSCEQKFFLALAYDVRKAYELCRETIKPPQGYSEVGLRLGVDIVWPVLLIQSRMLRVGLSYMPHESWHQAITYDLEAVIEAAVVDDFPKTHAEILSAWRDIGQMQLSDASRRLDGRGGLYCHWTKAQRAKGLAALLDSFCGTHEATYDILLGAGRTDLIDPADIARFENAVEWDDPNF